MAAYTFEPEARPGRDRLAGPEACLWVDRLGGELVSFVVQDPRDGSARPLLWESSEPGVWPGRAPVLFPIVGALAGGASRCGERQIRLPMHGFAQGSRFDLVDGSAGPGGTEARYRLEATPASRKGFPFAFRLELRYTLHPGGLDLAMTVQNPGRRPLLCQCGWHPGFALPGGLGRAWRLELPETPAIRRFCLPGGVSLLTGERAGVPDLSRLTWSAEELEATVFLELPEPAGRWCRLRHRDTGEGLELSFPDFPSLALWAQRGRDFLCLEPCQGMDDHVSQEPFEEKVGILRIEPGVEVRRALRLKLLPPG